MRIVLFMLIAGWMATATADLYRWVDPETGSVKFSSYPPPWYGDEAREKGAPKVEHIPARSAPRADAPAQDPSGAPLKPPAQPKPGAQAPAKPAAGERPGT